MIEMSLKAANSQEKYNRFYKLKPEELQKFKDLGFLEKCGYQLYLINKYLKIGKDVYDIIRVYADSA